MQEMRRDGTDRLTGDADIVDIEKALSNEEVKEIRLHKIGSIFERTSGEIYEVVGDGNLKRRRDLEFRRCFRDIPYKDLMDFRKPLMPTTGTPEGETE